MMKLMDKNFEWTSEFYNKGEFNYGLKYWVHFKGYSISNTIWRNKFVKLLINLK